MLSAALFTGCPKNPTIEPDDPDDGGATSSFVISGVEIPSTISVEYGQDYSFTVKGKGPAKGDQIIFTEVGNNYKTVTTDVKDAAADSFTITIPSGLEEGEYAMKVRRGEKSITLTSSVKIQIIIKLPRNPSPDSNIYGLVLCERKPLAGVCVSDGFEVVQTDSQGYYEFKSNKAHKYVFVTLPSGYAAESDGVIPKIWRKTAKAVDDAERIDFHLIAEGDQSSHTMIVMGDIHLAKRTNDRGQFAKFTSELNQYLAEHKGDKVYGLTLGDMTWDLYWYANGYGFKEYLEDLNAVKGMQVFHTIGNHDHDMNAVGDWETAVAYKDMLAPDYYSFNIGNIHYIVLDNIQCTNAVASKKDGTNRTYVDAVVPDDLNWLMHDLKYVSKDTPVVVAMHAALHNQNGTVSLDNGDALKAYFKGYENVIFVTGHTHKMWTVDKGNIHEYNTGAVCAAWWWAGYYYPALNIAQDGAPGGYRVMNVKGKSIDSYYKGTGRDANYQFRVYDRNCINIDAAALAPGKATEFDKDLTKYGAYNTASNSNQVLINVWDYNSDWKISVTEGSKELKVSQITAYDPLYMITYAAGRYSAGAASLSFVPHKTHHIFSVNASSADSDLEVKVTDDEGTVYTQTVDRPLAFSIETYK